MDIGVRRGKISCDSVMQFTLQGTLPNLFIYRLHLRNSYGESGEGRVYEFFERWRDESGFSSNWDHG